MLERGELVKFAGLTLSLEECDRAIELARQVILGCATAPRGLGEDVGEGQKGKVGTVR